MDHIRTLLPRVLNKRGLLHEINASITVHHARQWLAKELPGFTGFLFARKFQHGELVIAARHSIAAQECQLRSEDLLAHLKAEGHSEVKKVRIIREDPPPLDRTSSPPETPGK